MHIINLDTVKEVILDFLHLDTGWDNLITSNTEEELTIMQMKEERDGTLTVHFEYSLIEDGYSQLDKKHIIVGYIVISSSGQILRTRLKETYTGKHVSFEPYKGQD